jgi:hypothetical protein
MREAARVSKTFDSPRKLVFGKVGGPRGARHPRLGSSDTRGSGAHETESGKHLVYGSIHSFARVKVSASPEVATSRETNGRMATATRLRAFDAHSPARQSGPWRPRSRSSEVVGGVVGGLAGAAAGAGIGFLAGGPIGAVVGGIIGLIGGAIVGALLGRPSLTGPIADPVIQRAMRDAWVASNSASAAGRHEEGGYIVRKADGTLGVERWPTGAGSSITPPARDATGRYNGLEVLGEFHTHPNPPVDEAGKHWVQEPHAGDTGAIAAEKYPGDSYIISADRIYRVRNDGTWDTLGGRRAIIGD